MLECKQEIPEMTDLLALYSSVGWTNYTNNPAMLEEAVKASLWQLAVYDEEELVAYIRLVGDGHSVIFVQDLLVRPDQQRQGIGTKLLEEALGTFPNVYQKLLATDRSEKNLAFYQSLGFVELSEQACTGMIYKYLFKGFPNRESFSCFYLCCLKLIVELSYIKGREERNI